ncbi:predicted protein [Chaetomium globosum CBS 148.51]|uniref:F-box domain-containing protein n=1 Tax=Chaetomium globosum (strain ATCC 6205 / CBS 148.51 / DSM 1962 / NBRC 6347 / NRRL 1970) TaxID=306901 RepID=Q2GVM7_CHAGB|nr:uncharacterized protein CHGG_07977 [Chaetomium globosum CBS 148.51]EAQ86724.1 predicted protein [Chaetomium globosum CBS 148.51]
MSPAEAIQQDAASQPSAASPILLDSLPVETLIEIISYTDFDTFDSIRATSQRLRSITDLHWYRILPGIIERDFHPVQEFFETVFDADVPSGMTCARLLMVSDTLDDGLHPLLGFCRVVRRWEAEFPRLRFASMPILRGFSMAMRRARWRIVGDARRAFMRQFSSARLHEAYDMWFVKPSAGECALRLMPLWDLNCSLTMSFTYLSIGTVVDEMTWPRIEESLATFGEATMHVFRERGLPHLGPFSQGLFPEPHGGILDYKHPLLEMWRAVHDGDAGVGDANYPGLSRITRRGRLEPNL